VPWSSGYSTCSTSRRFAAARVSGAKFGEPVFVGIGCDHARINTVTVVKDGADPGRICIGKIGAIMRAAALSAASGAFCAGERALAEISELNRCDQFRLTADRQPLCRLTNFRDLAYGHSKTFAGAHQADLHAHHPAQMIAQHLVLPCPVVA